ncbi:hypothetical protein DW261_03985 [Fusobacterium varium]|uniref:hypothetical protein n=1 Tax=Fusobacterium varium TaxID=856 RepID=UPI000E535C47|nr:hypothetical protein [Fusobacterium varium]RHG37057.1 hypothetical protein DW261_03985 [Fusobacterium varium]
MTDWKTKNKIKKTQIATARGSQSINLQSLFEGAGVEKAQVFTLNDGIILGSTSCDYSTSWSYGEKSVTIDSMAKTWNTTPTLFFADIEDEVDRYLYLNGKFTTITIPSGYCLYTIEVSGKGTFTLYENEEPVTFELFGISKIYIICYKQKSETVKIRVSGLNISWAFMSSCYYFTKKTQNVKNTVVVTESVYGNFDTDKGITFPATPGEPPIPQIPAIGLLGYNDCFMDFYSMKKEGTNKNVASLSEFTFSDSSSIRKTTHVSFPHVISLNGEINLENTRYLSYLQLGTLNNPVVWENPKLKLFIFHHPDLNLTIYTKGAVPFEIEITPEYSASKVKINFKDSEVV